ncbi:hypothetical protein [Caballeronia sordidicola]|uniref:Uncharacterized protein n=1 Tax=Caballeronia sordidicola TaxID=196367 RepID=A0A226X0P0_CABSO|nr:hypothetical protein [Caballeronia sordidicola]OXC76913.1 hypothetical protein BSU04_18050 [Caballeronia sordidicola]
MRSLLIVVDDPLFGEASRKRDGNHFANSLGSTLGANAGSIPVTLLQIDSEADARALPKTILSSHATQIMLVKATRVTTTSRGDAEAVWQLAISDVNASIVPNEHDPSRPNTRVEMKTFYREQISADVIAGLDIFVGGIDKNAEKMGLAIAARLREEHVLTPDPSVGATPVVTPEHS